MVATNLRDIYERFPTEAACISLLEMIRWQGTPKCPYCSATRCTPFLNNHRYHCNGCFTAFSVTVRTPFHRTHVPLQKWFLAITLTLDTQMRIPVRQLAGQLGVTKNTAWSIGRHIHSGMIRDDHQAILEAIFVVLKGRKP